MRAPHPNHRATRINAHPKQRQANTVHAAGCFIVKSPAHDVKCGLVGNEDGWTQPTCFVLDIAVKIAAAGGIDRESEWVPEQHVGEFMGQVILPTPGVM